MLGIDPKLYRHFAIGTIAVAVIVAVFSSGDAQQSMAGNEQSIALKKAEESKFGKTRLVDKRDESTKQNSANAGFGADPAPPSGFEGSANAGPGGAIADMGPPKMTVMIEPNQAEMAKMSADQRKAYLKKLQTEATRLAAKGPYMPTQEQLASLEAESIARAGPPTTE